MGYNFEIARAVQSAAYLLKKYPQAMHNYTCVLKMLYLADKRSIQETGSPITGDRPVSMNSGPLISKVYDLIRDRSFGTNQEMWSRYIELVDRDIRLKEDPGVDELTEFETDLLDGIFDEFGALKLGEMLDLVHDLPEHIECYVSKNLSNTSVDIPLPEILKAVGREVDLEAISRQKTADECFARIFH